MNRKAALVRTQGSSMKSKFHKFPKQRYGTSQCPFAQKARIRRSSNGSDIKILFLRPLFGKQIFHIDSRTHLYAFLEEDQTLYSEF